MALNISLTCRPQEMKRKLRLPMYDVTLWIVVTDDLEKAFKPFVKYFGNPPDSCCAACGHDYRSSQFALFFRRNGLTLNTVCHEVFHLTHRLMDWAGVDFDAAHSEHGAMLHGYLMELVCKTLAKRR